MNSSSPKKQTADLDSPAPFFTKIPPHWLGLIVVAIVFIAVTALTWLKWPDILVDFGPQLYVPWRISLGDVLYRDLKYLPGGPFSQYFNALLFKIFGVSFLTLVLTNLAIVAGMLLLVYRNFLRASDTWTATTLCLVLIIVFAFGQYTQVGNYTYLCPYSHEVLHGLALSILAVVFLSKWLTQKRIGFALAAGFCCGLVFLTKPEIFLALALCVAVAFVLSVWKTNQRSFCLKSSGGFFLAALTPLLGFFFYFHSVEDTHGSWRSVMFAWIPLLESHVTKDAYYLWCLGLDVPAFHLRKMFLHFISLVLVVAIYSVLFRRKNNSRGTRIVLYLSIGILLVASSGFAWIDCGRSLPLITLALGFTLFFVPRSEFPVPRSTVFPLLWTILSFGLLAKMGFFTRIWHYGFALAMPAAMGAIYFLVWLLPRRLEKYGVHFHTFRIASSLALLVGVLRLATQSEFHYQNKNSLIGSGPDQIKVTNPTKSPTDAGIRDAVEWIEKNTSPAATVAVVPEGAIVNYFTRRINPTSYLGWSPPEMEVFGETNMVAAFRANIPDYIVLIHRDHFEYGVNYFGKEPKFGYDFMQWVRQNYEPVLLIGHEPLQDFRFGVKILKALPRKN